MIACGRVRVRVRVRVEVGVRVRVWGQLAVASPAGWEGGEGAADRVTKASALFPLSVAICFVSPASASASACASLRLASAGATMA